jgi:hypothetical protein
VRLRNARIRIGDTVTAAHRRKLQRAHGGHLRAIAVGERASAAANRALAELAGATLSVGVAVIHGLTRASV